MPLNSDRPVFRFAPSTNGFLHLGHALSAFENEKRAEMNGGKLLLRIEDIDLQRCTPEKEKFCVEDLAWLGINFEGKIFRQSARFGSYQNALDWLIIEGLVYPAFMTRGEVSKIVALHEIKGSDWPRDPDGTPCYPDVDRNRSQAERRELLGITRRHAWRLNMAAALERIKEPIFWMEETDTGINEVAASPCCWGDIVLSRSDAPSSYHLSSVIDDAVQGITHVVRGSDLYHATSIHRLLQNLLGFKAPLYRHHRLLLAPSGKKLSKSNGDTSLRQLRAEGKSPLNIRVMCGF